ncbi:MAG: TIGR01244 family sulfur transferase [Hyphomonadaceae bacterium]|nr:TIGR01244 family sulfur transferase [Hyphomonadaceae bacterium]
MSAFRSVTPDFAVAPQLALEDFAAAAAAGFKTVINNRPDGEAPGQPSSAEAEAAAKAAGLAYHHIPVQGGPAPAAVEQMAAALEATRGTPVLAYCRSGMRSITTWGLAQAVAGARTPDEIVALAAEAGYDLSGARGALQRLTQA